jgi:hypothetical protein
MAHEKTIAQSRDRQGADPLADARGSVHTSIFEAGFADIWEKELKVCSRERQD